MVSQYYILEIYRQIHYIIYFSLYIVYLEKQMFQYAKELKFEEAAKTRDKIEELRSALVKF